MFRWAIRLLAGVAGVLALGALAGATCQHLTTRRELMSVPPPGRLVDVGGHRLHLWCTGAGEPAVMLDSGLGGSSVDWGFVQPEVARFTRVCSYDRAGMGYSDPGPSPRTARRIARELGELVARSGMTESLVLVGASLGGFTVRVFAAEHADRVAGLVLVDPTHEDQTHEIPRMAPFVPLLSSLGVFRLLGVSFGRPPESLAPAVREFARATRFRAAGYQAAAGEFIHVHVSASEVRASRRRLAAPVLVLTGGRNADPTWRQLHRDQAALSERGCHRVVDGAGHVIAVDQPQVVVHAIRTIVEAARRNTAPVCTSPPAPS